MWDYLLAVLALSLLQWRCKPPIKREKEREVCVHVVTCNTTGKQNWQQINERKRGRKRGIWVGGGLGVLTERKTKAVTAQRRWRRKKRAKGSIDARGGWREACVAIGASKADVSISFGLPLTLKRETLKLLHRRLLLLWSPSDQTPPNGTATKTGAPTSPRGIPCKPAQNHSPTMERWLTAWKKCVNILAALVPRAEGERQV